MTYFISSGPVKVECENEQDANAIAEAFGSFSSAVAVEFVDLDKLWLSSGWEEIKIFLDPALLNPVVALLSAAGGLVVGGALKEVGKDMYEGMTRTVRRCSRRHKSPRDWLIGPRFVIDAPYGYPSLGRSDYRFERGRPGKMTLDIGLRTVFGRKYSERRTENGIDALFRHLERHVAPIFLAITKQWPEAELHLEMVMKSDGEYERCHLLVARYIEPSALPTDAIILGAPHLSVLLEISPKGVSLRQRGTE